MGRFNPKEEFVRRADQYWAPRIRVLREFLDWAKEKDYWILGTGREWQLGDKERKQLCNR